MSTNLKSEKGYFVNTQSNEETTREKAKHQVVDGITRILSVDLSTYRDFGLKPVVETDKQVFGVMSENSQKLFCVKYDLRKEAERIKLHIRKVMLEHELAGLNQQASEEGCLKFQVQVKAMADQYLTAAVEAKLMGLIFWDMLRLELPTEAAGKNLSIRDGYQVVEVEEAESILPAELVEFLRELIGVTRG